MELLCAGSKYSCALLGVSGLPLWLGDETITASDTITPMDTITASGHVRIRTVTISSYLNVNVNVNEQFLSPHESCNIVTMAAP